MRAPDTNPGETNPCTGTTGTILDDEQGVFHITSLANGTLRLTGHSTVAVTFLSDDPTGVRYDGHETFTFSEDGTGGAFATTMTTLVRVKGTDGSFLTFREVAHLTVTASGASTTFDRPTLLWPVAIELEFAEGARIERLLLYSFYELARGLVVGNAAEADLHAHRLVALERSLHLFLEANTLPSR